MTAKYLKNAVARAATPPQTEPLDERQVKNSAGGYSYSVGDWGRLDRFLILGSEGGSYYATERKLTAQNIDAMKHCVVGDGNRAVRRTVEISVSGRAPKNGPALLVLAYAAAKGDLATRMIALDSLSDVARTGTHLFTFVDFVRQFRGWGRGLRRAVNRWYTDKSPEALALQVVKYQQRDGWSHRDLMRLRHVKFSGPHQAIARWVVKGELSDGVPALIDGHAQLQASSNPADAAELLRKYRLPRESVPTELLGSASVWEALLEKMPMTAMIRNLGNMSKVGLLTPFSYASRHVRARLEDEDAIRKARVHPLAVLLAMKTYEQGRGVRGHGEWKAVPQVVSALDAAFYKAFANVEPSGKNFYLGVDVSGSMSVGTVAGAPGITPCCGAAALAMVVANSEPNYYVSGFADVMREIPVHPRDSLTSVMAKFQMNNFGGTDCALPVVNATTRKMKVDCFVVLTDGETWAGQIHAAQALERYRQKQGVDAKLVVIGMVANEVTVADPSDPGSANFVGFDASFAQALSEFVRL